MDELRHLLQNTNLKKRQGLKRILDADRATPASIVDAFWWNAQSVFGYVAGDEPSYREIVRQVATKLGVKHRADGPVSEIEIAIARKVVKELWSRMTPEQRQQMERELQATAEKFDKAGTLVGTAGLFSVLTAAQLSGFGVYLLASTALGAITGAAGIALPFAVYTAVSGIIGTVIGPVGFIGFGLLALWKLTAANYRRLVPAVIYVSILRNEPC